jgi:hypothetical protein
VGYFDYDAAIFGIMGALPNKGDLHKKREGEAASMVGFVLLLPQQETPDFIEHRWLGECHSDSAANDSYKEHYDGHLPIEAIDQQQRHKESRGDQSDTSDSAHTWHFKRVHPKSQKGQ